MKNAWVIGSAVSPSLLGLTEKAAGLLRVSGQALSALIIGETLSGREAGMLAAAGAARICHLPADPEDLNAVPAVLAALVELYERELPACVLFESSVFFSALAPAFACAVRCGITADCTDLALREDGRLLQIRPAFGGREQATNLSVSGCSIATVRKGVFRGRPNAAPREAAILRLPAPEPAGPWMLTKTLADELHDVDLCGAPLIVSGGLGMKSRENFRRLYTLAERTGAAVGASRAAVAAGFAGYERQVGQTGVSVHPELYVAFGISGAVQHLSGITGAKKIVAVNTDPHAPIHDYSDLSITADCSEVLERLIRLLGG